MAYDCAVKEKAAFSLVLSTSELLLEKQRPNGGHVVSQCQEPCRQAMCQGPPRQELASQM